MSLSSLYLSIYLSLSLTLSSDHCLFCLADHGMQASSGIKHRFVRDHCRFDFSAGERVNQSACSRVDQCRVFHLRLCCSLDYHGDH